MGQVTCCAGEREDDYDEFFDCYDSDPDAGPPAEEKFRCLGVGLRVKKLLVVPVRVRGSRNRPYPCPRRPRGIAAPPCKPRIIVCPVAGTATCTALST